MQSRKKSSPKACFCDLPFFDNFTQCKLTVWQTTYCRKTLRQLDDLLFNTSNLNIQNQLNLFEIHVIPILFLRLAIFHYLPPGSHSLFRQSVTFMTNQSSLTLFLAHIPALAIQFDQPFLLRPVGQIVPFCSFCIICPSFIYPRLSSQAKKKQDITYFHTIIQL